MISAPIDSLQQKTLNGAKLDALPPALHQIAERIDASRAFIRSDDSDNDAGYDVETWRRAARFVGDVAVSYWQSKHRVPPLPTISDGPDGVVDVRWKHEGRQVLLTLSPEPDDIATFYDRDLDTNRDVIQGELILDNDNEWLLAWLTRYALTGSRRTFPTLMHSTCAFIATTSTMVN